MKAAVIGSRSFTDYEKLKSVLSSYHITEIISGGAKGADSLAEQYAIENNITLTVFLPNYDKHPPKIAPLIRNEEIIKHCDECYRSL